MGASRGMVMFNRSLLWLVLSGMAAGDPAKYVLLFVATATLVESLYFDWKDTR